MTNGRPTSRPVPFAVVVSGAGSRRLVRRQLPEDLVEDEDEDGQRDDGRAGPDHAPAPEGHRVGWSVVVHHDSKWLLSRRPVQISMGLLDHRYYTIMNIHQLSIYTSMKHSLLLTQTFSACAQLFRYPV